MSRQFATADLQVSPLLSQKVVDKEINNPLLKQNQPEPERKPDPEPEKKPEQEQKQDDPRLKRDTLSPDDFQRQQQEEQKADKKTAPGGPQIDRDIGEWSGDYDNPEGDENVEGGKAEGTEGGGVDSLLSEENYEIFSKIAVQGFAATEPQIFALFAKIKMSEIKHYVERGVLPPNVIPVVEKINQNVINVLSLTDQEIKLLEDAFLAFLKWKQFTAANPGTGLMVAVATIMVRQAFSAFKLMKENKAMVQQMIREWGVVQNKQQASAHPEAGTGTPEGEQKKPDNETNDNENKERA